MHVSSNLREPIAAGSQEARFIDTFDAIFGRWNVKSSSRERKVLLKPALPDKFKELAVDSVSGSLHGHLTRASGDDVLVALTTTLRVIGRPDLSHVTKVNNICEERSQTT